MRVLVTGATGFVGSAICPRLTELGMDVYAGTRKLGEATTRNIVAVGNIDGNTDWTKALAGTDAVIHLAARVHVMRETAIDPLAVFRSVNVAGTENLARQAAAAGVRRLIFASTIKVSGEVTIDAPFTEDDVANPCDAYAVSKWEAEVALRSVEAQTGLEVVILRPPLMYGPGVKGNFRRLLSAVARGFPLPLGAVANRRSLLYVGNFVDAIVACLTHPSAAGRTYLLSDGEAISSPELAASIAGLLGRPARLVAVPPGLIRTGATLLGRRGAAERLLGSLEVDSSRIGHELAWRPPYSLREGLADTVAWYRGLTAASSKDNMPA